MKLIQGFIAKHAHAALVNYKTTLAGIAALVHALSIFARTLADVSENPEAMPTPEELALAKGELILAWGLLFARDQDKSSQDTGVRR
jgi:hypothetical protein